MYSFSPLEYEIFITLKPRLPLEVVASVLVHCYVHVVMLATNVVLIASPILIVYFSYKWLWSVVNKPSNRSSVYCNGLTVV